MPRGSFGALPEHGVGQSRALEELSRLLAAGSADPGHPWCAAHLHGPTLAVAAAADLVGSVLNPSMDSWDQAPVASELERQVTRALAALCFPSRIRADSAPGLTGPPQDLVGPVRQRADFAQGRAKPPQDWADSEGDRADAAQDWADSEGDRADAAQTPDPAQTPADPPRDLTDSAGNPVDPPQDRVDPAQHRADSVRDRADPPRGPADFAGDPADFARDRADFAVGMADAAGERADAVLTSGGTESNLVGMLLARETGRTRVVCGRNAHHSVARAAWLLGLPTPRVIDIAGGRVRAGELGDLTGQDIVVATAGTTDTGAIDPLPEIAAAARKAGAWLHVDASYGGGALFSDRLAPKLDGLDRADSVALDLHKFGWQPIAAGVLATRERITALDVRADYLNAADDTEAGLPDLLGRSIRTSRRPDCFKIAVTLRALGRVGLGALVERCCALADQVADEVERHRGLRLWGRPELSTLLIQPVGAPAAAVRRRLLDDGTAVLGRATMDGETWLKLTLLHPEANLDDYRGLLDLVDATARRIAP